MLRKVLNFCLLSLLSQIFVNASEPYCTLNETIITRIPVMKTRLKCIKPTGFFKALKKTKCNTETYEDYEEKKQVKPIRVCCDGFLMSELEICEPFCEGGCPENSVCAAPNICACNDRYVMTVDSIKGSHRCEPICQGTCPENAFCAQPDTCECEPGYHEVNLKCLPHCKSGCPHGGKCTAPDFCECAEGYSFESGTCMPVCKAGDGCQHGRCIAPENCICDSGFMMNRSTQLCEDCSGNENCASYEETTPLDYDETTETTQTEQNIGFTVSYQADEIDENAKTICPPNHFFYGNVCRPKQFASNEFDCRFKPCVQNAFCQANGTCACNAGYIWFKPQNQTAPLNLTGVVGGVPVNETQNLCLTPTEIAVHLANIKYDNDDDDSFDWLSVVIISLCVLAILILLVALKMLWTRKGKLNVEAKNDLSCSYDNKSYNSSPHVY